MVKILDRAEQITEVEEWDAEIDEILKGLKFTEWESGDVANDLNDLNILFGVILKMAKNPDMILSTKEQEKKIASCDHQGKQVV